MSDTPWRGRNRITVTFCSISNYKNGIIEKEMSIMDKNNMNCFLGEQKNLQDAIDKIVEELFWQVARIHLHRCECATPPSKELCTVYTTFSGGYKSRFFFCVEPALMKRMAENMAEEPVTDLEDIYDYMKEFVNVVCGHIVASIFNKTEVSARFLCPEIVKGYEIPKDADDDIITTHYTSAELEDTVLVYDSISTIAG